MPKTVLRTLLFVENKSQQLLYGHSIVWILSDLDYFVHIWKRFEYKGISAYFKDIEDRSEIDNAISQGTFHLNSKFDLDIHFNLPETESFFIEQSNEEKNFNPFISLCTFAKAHFGDSFPGATHPVDYIRSHKESFDAMKDRYCIDLQENPHLIGTFTIYEPTRIEETFKGCQADNLVGYRIALQDFFNLYPGAQVHLESFSDSTSYISDITLDGDLHEINCGFVPDRHTTTIEHEGRIIYKSSFSLLKRISITTNINQEKRIIAGDKIIKQTSSSTRSFDV
ncbi:hypothetical protein [Vogesella oryzae]|uniref:hypothetical protein n=1 Tax=Vogesella oryzae TaxID=1735285 RepID=UPI0015824C1C|nr:hypothetical protein [Vogesella oryzae]